MTRVQVFGRISLVLISPVAALCLISVFSPTPKNLGAIDGKLARCPNTPNCVSSEASGSASMPPIPFSIAADETVGVIRKIVEQLPRARVVTANHDYLHVEFVSLVFRFVDDVEFQVDATNRVVHFRSASRAGKSDLGANRARMQELTELLTVALSRTK